MILGKTDVHYTYWDIVQQLPDRTVIRRQTRVWKVGTICIWLARDRRGKKFLVI